MGRYTYGAGGLKITNPMSTNTQTQTTIHALHKTKDKTLWDEVAAAYADLRQTHLGGATPPSSQGLSELAKRLREARY